MKRYVISTLEFRYLCRVLEVSQNLNAIDESANCGLLRLSEDYLALMTSQDINDILFCSHEEYDFICDVIKLRITPHGAVYPGSGGLPTIDQQRKEREALVKFNIEAHKKMCAEDPNHPECQEDGECAECDEDIALNEDEFNELVQGE